jgi:hypothetical protein
VNEFASITHGSIANLYKKSIHQQKNKTMANFIEYNMQYVIGGGRSRIPRMPMPGPSNPPGLAQIGGPQPIVQNASTGTKCFSLLPDATKVVNGVTLYYAFTSMSGGVEGGDTTTNINQTLMQTIASPTQDVIQLNVYLPHGNYGPGGGAGAIIDAFDETKGMFVNDLFVTVSPDKGGTITHDANYLGALSSSSTEAVSAYNYITPSNANFDKWMIIPGTGNNADTVSGNDLTVGQNTNVVAFAYYKDASKNRSKEFYKEIADRPLKEISADILPYIDKGDPAWVINQVQVIAEKINALEGRINELGSSFIKSQNRPEVGKQVTGKASKR